MSETKMRKVYINSVLQYDKLQLVSKPFYLIYANLTISIEVFTMRYKNT